jgi:serine protease Do
MKELLSMHRMRLFSVATVAFTLTAVAPAVIAAPGAEPYSAAQAARRTPVVDVFQRTRDAVVNISATQVFESTVPYNPFDELFGNGRRAPQTRRYTRTSIGSGFVLHPDGYVVTNAHVLAASHKVIFADKSEHDAEIIAVDEKHDLAVLKIKADRPLPALTLGRSDDIMVGETVIAIGNPLGYEHTVTSGIISAVNRTLDIDENSKYENLLQTDASINRGNSGGPLLNVLGELIGINTAIRGDAQNIGFAIPVDSLRKLLPELLSVERGRQRLEVGLRLGWRGKLVVTESRGPAATAGIEAGDELVSIDGKALPQDIDFYVYLLKLKPTDHLMLELRRSGKAYKATVLPHAIPVPDGGKLLETKFGIAVRPLTPEQAKDLDLKGGLIITRVEPGSPADQAGFQRGLVVVQVGQFFPTNMEDLGLLLEKVHPGEKTMFRVWRIGRDYIQVYAVPLISR